MSKTGSGSNFYADYLKLDDVLAAQHTLSDHPDEMQFIIVHQVHELWFKLALHQLTRTREAMQADDLLSAVRLSNHVVGIFGNLIASTELLHALPPLAFHSFRQFLAAGSGMQSFQFREIEFLLGRRDPKYLEWVDNLLANDRHLDQIKARLAEPSLAETLEQVLARHHIADFATVYAHPERCPEVYALADVLSVLEHHIIRWRYAHIQLVERTIGAGTMGTGGTSHDYLQKAAQTRFFPALWEARNELSRRVDSGST